MSNELKIRHLESRDLPLRVAWLNDPRINATLNIRLPITIQGTEAWFERARGNENRADFAFDDAGDVVAMGGFTGIDFEVKKAELYIFVNPARKGRGIGSRAVMQMCAYGFEKLGLEKIYLHVNADNLPARRIYEKCGFRMEGLMFREIINNGKIKDRCYYARYKTEEGIPPPIIGQSREDETFFLCQDMKIADRKIKIVRDDLFPGVGGGNKARKMEEYERELRRGGFDAVVTTGGIQSNHNRAVALAAARNGWRCHIVFHGSRERFFREGGNAALVQASGASVEFVEAEQISFAMDTAMERFRQAGRKPYYITGGGHDSAGGNAYVRAAQQLFVFGEKTGCKPDVIFLASGTGSTQAGLLVGLEKVGWGDVKVVGISVARQRERGAQVVRDFTLRLAREHKIPEEKFAGKIHFSDEYLFGGYEQSSDEMREFLAKTIRETGIVFDSTYSGKALFGMNEILKKSDSIGNALFWHTGGILNFLATGQSIGRKLQ